MNDDIFVLDLRRTPEGWAVMDREAALERLGLSMWEVEQQAWEERAELAAEAYFEAARDD